MAFFLKKTAGRKRMKNICSKCRNKSQYKMQYIQEFNLQIIYIAWIQNQDECVSISVLSSIDGICLVLQYYAMANNAILKTLINAK